MTNTIWTGDNLFILNGINSNSVDLIYLDPPFNSKILYAAPVGSKAAGSAFKDTWTWQDVDQHYLEKIISNYPNLVQFIQSVGELHSKAMMAYITYMIQRIIEMHRVLKDTGSLYLHCDPTASHYLKIVLDKIFGTNNLVGCITWKRHSSVQKGSQYKAKTWGVTTDDILHYKKGNSTIFSNTRELLKDEVPEKFPLVDEKGDRYRLDNSHIFRTPNMGPRPNLCYTWKGFTNPHDSGWRLSKSRLEEEYKKGNISITKKGKLERRKYLKDYEGVPIGNLWDDINPPGKTERTGYPTQKPLALMHRIIKASSNEGDLVLDPFCGCATTCVAAQQLNRKWIGIDISEKSADLVIDRLSDDGGLFSDFVHRNDIPQRTDIKKEPPSLPIKARLYKKQKGKCFCDFEGEIRHFEIDHIIPQSKGGGDYFENYQLLCSNCNRMKGNRPQELYEIKIKQLQKHKKTLFFG